MAKSGTVYGTGCTETQKTILRREEGQACEENRSGGGRENKCYELRLCMGGEESASVKYGTAQPFSAAKVSKACIWNQSEQCGEKEALYSAEMKYTLSCLSEKLIKLKINEMRKLWSSKRNISNEKAKSEAICLEKYAIEVKWKWNEEEKMKYQASSK